MTDDKIIKDAQYRKGLGIAWFNATNAAIALASVYKPMQEEVKDFVARHRDWLLKEHEEYYRTVISPVGRVYKAEDTIKKLKQAKNEQELRLIWISISEDERRDGDILKVAKELKEKFKTL